MWCRSMFKLITLITQSSTRPKRPEMRYRDLASVPPPDHSATGGLRWTKYALGTVSSGALQGLMGESATEVFPSLQSLPSMVRKTAKMVQRCVSSRSSNRNGDCYGIIQHQSRAVHLTCDNSSQKSNRHFKGKMRSVSWQK
jgi:hypothetical protein